MSAPFLILAVITLAATWAAMMLRGLVHCALALAVAFAGIGLLYLNLGAQFLGLAQLLVYVGAIAVLIVFVILLTRGGENDRDAYLSQWPVAGATLALGMFAVIAWAILHSRALPTSAGTSMQPDIRALGNTLMADYVLPLEVIGFMLTAALIGAVIVAMKDQG